MGSRALELIQDARDMKERRASGLETGLLRVFPPACRGSSVASATCGLPVTRRHNSPIFFRRSSIARMHNVRLVATVDRVSISDAYPSVRRLTGSVLHPDEIEESIM